MTIDPPLRDFTQHADSVFWVVDEAMRLIYVSPAFERIWRRPSASVLGEIQAFLSTVHPDDLPELLKWIEEGTQEGNRRSFEYRILRPDGEVRWIRTRAFPVAPGPGGEPRFAGMSDDVTVERQGHAALMDLTRRLSRTLESLSEAVFLVDEAEGRIVDCNAAALRLFGYSRAEVMGAPTRLLHASDESFREFQERSRRSLDTDGLWNAEFPMRRSDGTVFEAAHTLTFLDAEEGLGDSVVSVVRDLSGERELQRRLYRAQRLEAVGRLAGGVAHDFNNLLTVIRGNAELVGEAPEVPAHFRPLLRDIGDAARRGAEVTAQLLAFGRRQVLEPRPMELAGVLREVEPLLQRLMGEDVEIRLELPEDETTVDVDPGRLEQATLNLAMNARQAMPRGGRFTLRLRREEQLGAPERARLPEAGPGPHVVLEVEDTGSGMGPETLDRIFEPFFTTRADEGGTGLGLPSVYGMVTQSGGSMAVESELGKGTRFLLCFPASSRPASPSTDGVRPPERSRGEGERILVTEDDPAVRRALVRILEREGFQVTAVGSAEEALQRLASGEPPPDLCLSDVVLPGASGIHLARVLRRDHPRLPVLLISGYSEERLAMEDGAEGLPPLLPKPFSPGEVVGRIRELLDRSDGTVGEPRGGSLEPVG